MCETVCDIFYISNDDLTRNFTDQQKDEAKAQFKLILRVMEASSVLRYLPTLDITVLERLLFHISYLHLWPSMTRHVHSSHARILCVTTIIQICCGISNPLGASGSGEAGEFIDLFWKSMIF